MTDNITGIADSINRLADAVFSLGGTIAFIGFLFLLFKNMGGQEKIEIRRKEVEKK